MSVYRTIGPLVVVFFRLDYVHCASKLAQEKFRIKDPDYYDLESELMCFTPYGSPLDIHHSIVQIHTH